MKIKQKLLFFILVPLLPVVLAVVFLIFYATKSVFYSQELNALTTVSDSRKQQIVQMITQRQEALNLITSRTKLRTVLQEYNQAPSKEQQATMTDIMSDALVSSSYLERLSLVNLNGQVIASTNEQFLDYQYDLKYLNQWRFEDKAVLLNQQGKPYLLLAGPLRLNGEVLGVMVSVYDMEVINQIANDRTGLGETGEVLMAIYDNDKLMILNEKRHETPANLDYQTDDRLAAALKAATQGKAQRLKSTIDYRGENILAATAYVDELGIGVSTEIDASEVNRNLNNLLIYFVVGGTLPLLFIVFVVWLVSISILNPIEDLERQVNAIAQGDLNYKITINRRDEIGQLANSFSNLVSSLKASRQNVDKKVAAQTKQIQESVAQMNKQRKALINVLEDVADEKNKVAQHAQDLRKYQLAIENSSEGIIITDPEGTVIFANPAVSKITGFENESTPGKKLEEIWGLQLDKEKYPDLWHTVKDEKQTFEGELETHRQSGEQYYSHVSISPVIGEDDEIEFFVSIQRDISHEKEVDRMKTEFISLASHQLRTPLSAMRWFLEMLLNGDAGKLKKEQEEMITNIDESNQRMIALVNGLLNISRIESGRIIIDPEPTDLRELIQNVIDEMGPRIKEKEIAVVVSMHKDLGKVAVDPKLTREVYRNLLTNAVKYSPAGSQVEILVSKDEENIISQVTDQGVGIPQKDQDQIFQKFHRGSNVVKTETDGTGLGLYLTKSIVESQDGKIWFESEEEKGTSFWFTIPLDGVEAKDGEVQLDESSADTSSRGKDKQLRYSESQSEKEEGEEKEKNPTSTKPDEESNFHGNTFKKEINSEEGVSDVKKE